MPSLLPDDGRTRSRPVTAGAVVMAVAFALLVVALAWGAANAHAAPTGFGGCWFACKERHPIRSQYPYHSCRTVACQTKKDRTTDDGRSVPTVSNSLYPCAHRWFYLHAPYWHLHYADGRHGRTHAGTTTSYRRCL